MSKLDLSDLVPEVQKIMDQAKGYGLETEVIAQMLVNAHNKKGSEVIPAIWGALEDWDIPLQKEEDDFNQQLIKEEI